MAASSSSLRRGSTPASRAALPAWRMKQRVHSGLAFIGEIITRSDGARRWGITLQQRSFRNIVYACNTIVTQ
jgi:hypothetical protein